MDIGAAPLPVPDPSIYYGESRNPVIDDRHMPKPQFSYPRKRPRSEQYPPQLNETLQPVSKKQKLSPPSGSAPPPAFWDNLSKKWLTKRALRELDRRNASAAPSSPSPSYRRLHRPVTRRALAEWKKKKKNWQPTQPAADFLSNCAPRCLQAIKLLGRHGGPDLSDLRGYRRPPSPLDRTMRSNQSSSRGRKRGSITTSSTKPTTNTATTKSTGPYDRAFQQNLIDAGVYPHGYKYPDGRVSAKPNNWKEISQKLAQPRPSLSPSKFSDEAHERFIQADVDAFKEKEVTESVIPVIEGKIRDAKCVSGGIPFTNLDHLTDGTLVPGNPDRYYGARPEQLDRRVRDKLSGHIIPSTQHDLPIAPNFFLAAKGPDGSLAVAGRQACYDGTLGARGMHSLQSYGQEPVYDGNASTITSIYHGGQLKMYTTHPSQPINPGGRSEYFMTQINTWGMTGNVETFRQGANAYRNARDWAKEQRDEAIRRANEIASECQAGARPVDSSFGPVSSFASEASQDERYIVKPLSQESQISLNEDSNTTAVFQESDVSTDELVLDNILPGKRSSRHSKQSYQFLRKRRNVGGSSGTGHAIDPPWQKSPASDATTQQSEERSWMKGRFQYAKGNAYKGAE